MMKDHKLTLMTSGNEIWLGDSKTANSGDEFSPVSYEYNMRQGDSLEHSRKITPRLHPWKHHYHPLYRRDGWILTSR